MTANIRTVLGQISKQKISGKPFKYRGLWFFVYRSSIGTFIIDEWSTGAGFNYANNEKEIKPAIDAIFKKVGEDKIKDKIKKYIEDYGIANASIPEGGEA